MKILKLLVLPMIALQLVSCASTSQPTSAVLSDVIIAEPLSVNYKSEIALARLTEVIHRAEITDAQRAQLFYDRGVIYDSVGLKSLARLDFNRAIRLKPDLVDAYNFLGIQYTQLQQYNQAYDAFDSAIELSPKHQYAYLNRGIALYYGGRPQLSLKDLQKFYNFQKNDPYRAVWLYIAEQKVDPQKAKLDLLENSKNLDPQIWAKQIADLYLGKLSAKQFLKNLPIGVQDDEKLADRLCEAYFYLGKYYLAQNQTSIAANYFKLALSTNVYEFVEHRYAKLELDLIRDQIKGKVVP